MSEKNVGERNASQPDLLSIARIVLGIILIWKSIRFIRNTVTAQDYIEQTGIDVLSKNADTLATIITYLTLLCGFFILVGLFTRVSAIIQIPVLIVAVFFITSKNIDRNLLEFLLSIVTLLLLILFAVKGSGPLSSDEYFRRGAAIDRE